jgi:hypothetical protein
MTVDGCPGMVTMNSLGTLLTHVTGTATGYEMDDGTLTTDGMETNCVAGTEMTLVDGNVTTNTDGTVNGTFSLDTITVPGDPGIVTIWVLGNEFTHV